jgi:predicted metal-dependent HD superfamily phosphohydrolase
MNITVDLRNLYQELVDQCAYAYYDPEEGIPDQWVNSNFTRLMAQWSTPGRHYHTLKHLYDCITEFRAVKTLCDNPLDVEQALWFHDACYDPKGLDNELSSIHQTADLYFGHDYFDEMYKLIMATKTHEPTTDPDVGLVLDVDLSILGKSPQVYDEYAYNIRKEYYFVDEVTFNTKRIQVLNKFLNRQNIYNHRYFQTRYEQQARLNIRNEIMKLKTALNHVYV